jgi:hypothetical protein
LALRFNLPSFKWHLKFGGPAKSCTESLILCQAPEGPPPPAYEAHISSLTWTTELWSVNPHSFPLILVSLTTSQWFEPKVQASWLTPLSLKGPMCGVLSRNIGHSSRINLTLLPFLCFHSYNLSSSPHLFTSSGLGSSHLLPLLSLKSLIT